jgi:hypothetical protein
MYQLVLEKILEEEYENIPREPIVEALVELHNGQWWESKVSRLKGLIEPNQIAEILVHLVGFNYQIQELVSRIASQLSPKIKFEDQVRNASDVIEACNGILWDLERESEDSDIVVKSLYILEPMTYKILKDRESYVPLLAPSYWESNTSEHYGESMHCILGSSNNRHQEQQALDVLNILGSIGMQIDPDIHLLEELPNKELVNPDSAEQFREYLMRSKELREEYIGKTFYLLVQFDKRGRMYSKGYHINIQGSGYQKASISFIKQDFITGEL